MVIWGILGAMGLSRVIYSASGTAIHKTAFSQGLRSPLFQGGGFGVGYTGGAYLGYGGSNTWDPLGVHQTYKHPQSKQFRMPYGSYGYGRRRYRRRYGYSRYGRRSRYGYRRRSYYRRSYY